MSSSNLDINEEQVELLKLLNEKCKMLSENFLTLAAIYQEYSEKGMSDELNLKYRNLGMTNDGLIEEIQKAETKLVKSDKRFKNLMR